MGAFKIELPQELMDKIDVVHERFRNPTQYYCKKDVVREAKWLGPGARSAKDAANDAADAEGEAKDAADAEGEAKDAAEGGTMSLQVAATAIVAGLAIAIAATV